MNKSTIRKKFGTRIQNLRKRFGLSQEELGFKAKLHRTYIGSIEQGKQNVSLENIAKVAKALNLKIEELFKDI